MSTDLLLSPHGAGIRTVAGPSYRHVVGTHYGLPEPIGVCWSFDSERAISAPPPAWLVTPPRRLFKEPIPHVLLVDPCGNTLWLHEAIAHDVEYQHALELGEASFTHFGLQGSLVHFGQAFELSRWTLYDAQTTLTWDDRYLRRTGDDVGNNHCRRCP